MATLGDLKTRIIAETNRDDLSDDLASALTRAISQSIEFYSNSRFWFNETISTAVTVVGNEYVAYPTGFIVIDRINITVGGASYPLRLRSLVQIEDMAKAVLTVGQPCDYANIGDRIRVWPKPNLAYALSFVGIADLTPNPLSADVDTNAWTTEAQDLIAARSRKILFRDQFRDEKGAALAEAAETESLRGLQHATAQRLGTGRVSPQW